MGTTDVLTAAGVPTRHPTRDRLWRGGALLLLPLLVFALATPFISATDPDYWWHLRTGQLILDTGAIPTVDDYSFTVTGQPWIAHEWLSELLIALLARGTGYVGVAFVFGVVCAATLGLVYATGRARGASPTTMALCCSWAMLMLQPSVNVRPQLFTMLLLALFALLLIRYRAGASRALWPLPALTVLWVNLHGGYLIGLVLLGLTLVGESGAAALGHRAAPWRPLLVTLILAALGSLLTPHGLDAVRYPLSYLGRENASLQFVAEWRSPDFHQPLFMPFAASLLLALTLGFANRPLSPTDSLWTLTVTFMALQSVRHIPLYAIIVTPLLAARLSAPLRAGWSPPARIRDRGRVLVGATAVALPLLLLGVGWQLASAPGGTRQLGPAPDPNGYPVGGVALLRTLPGEARLFNEYRWGGYLIAQLYPARRVFIDGRADPFGDALMTQYRRTLLAQPGWRAALDNWQIDLVLIDRDGPLATALAEDGGWRELYVGAVERLFARRGAGR